MITRHIMCCRSHPHQEGSVWNTNNQPESAGNEYVHKPIVPMETASDHANDTNINTDIAIESETAIEIATLNPPITNHQDIASIEGLSYITEWEMQVQKVHHPAWFSNDLGWKGTTYSDAEAFCNSIPHSSNTLELCPLQGESVLYFNNLCHLQNQELISLNFSTCSMPAYCPNGPVDKKPL